MMTDREERHPATVLAVCLWTVVGGVLRIVGLNQQLWYDEIVTVLNTIRIPPGQLFTHYVWDNQHTLYSQLAQLSVGAFGEHPWTVRLPAMIAGTLSIPALYILGRSVFSHRESICAAALLAVSYHHIWFSQNARGYTLLMLATVIATWCFLEGQRRSSTWHWMLYAVTVALGAYTHLTMVFVAVSHMLIAIWQWLSASYRGDSRAKLLAPALAIVASGVLTILLYAPMMDDMWAFYTADRPKLESEWNKVTWAAAEALRGLQLGYGLAVLAALSVIGLIGCWRFRRSSPLVLAMVLVPGLLGLAVMAAAGRSIRPRFFLYVFGNALLIVVNGVWGSAESAASWMVHQPQWRERWSAWLGYGLCGIVVIQSLRMLPRLYQVPKQDLISAMQFVEQQRQPTDQVATIGLTSDVYQRFYHVDWAVVEQQSELDELSKNGSRVWVVTSFPIHVKSRYPELSARLERDTRLVKVFPGTVGGGEIQVSLLVP
jgi:4-amino-4-deoxy-L-arabinose transferase-like glycosyltransferase